MSEAFFILLTFFVSIGASVLSGMAGGGSGFIVAPFFILIGLPPNLATATAKMNEAGVNASSILAMYRVRRRAMVTNTGAIVTTGTAASSNREVFFAGLLLVTMINVALAAWLIPNLKADGMQYIIAGLLLIMIPTLFMDKKAFKPGYRSKKWKRGGYIVYSIVSFFQALFGMGIGMFVSMVLMYMFGIPVAAANDLKRRLMIIQAVVLTMLLLMQGAVVISLGIAALAGALIGGHIGTVIGVKKGGTFIKKIMAGVMGISAISILL